MEKIFTLYKPRRGSKEPSRGGISNGCVSPSSTALRVEANMFCESQHPTRNQAGAQRIARTSTDHTGNAAASAGKNRSPSKYLPCNDLNEMRIFRDQARRMKNNSHYASSTQPQIVASLPSGKITIMTRVQNAESSKDINLGPSLHSLRPAGGPPPSLLPAAAHSPQGLLFL